MDRIRRRQIGARPFLRPTKFFVFHWSNFTDSVRFGAGERGKRHEFDVGDIHGTATGNLFFLVHRTGGISSFIISCLVRSFSLFERGWNWGGCCWRGKHGHWSKKSVDSPVDAEIEKRRSSLGEVWRSVNRDLFVRWPIPLQSFYGFYVGGGNCDLTLMIDFDCFDFDEKLFCKIYGGIQNS